MFGVSSILRRGRRVQCLRCALAAFLAMVACSQALQGGDEKPLPAQSVDKSAERIPGGHVPTFPDLADKYAKLEESADDWETEEFHNLLKTRVKLFEGGFVKEDGFTEALAAELAAPEFASGELRPSKLASVFDDGVLSCVRGEAAAAGGAERGPAALLRAARALRAPFAGGSDIKFTFKVFQIEPGAAATKVGLLISAFGKVGERRLQQNATWQSEWTNAQGAPPKLLSVQVSNFEEASCALAGETLFSDCTEAALGKLDAYQQQIRQHVMHWMANLDVVNGVTVSGHKGIAIGDVNGDGLEDLYSCQPGGLPKKLFLQERDGSLRDASRGSGTDYLEPARSALLVDLDNDGDQDLVLQTVFHALFLENDGRGVFARRSSFRTPSGIAVSAADIDGDMLLDVYVCCYSSPFERKPPLPYHDANNGSPNFMLRNLGGFRFEDVTANVGLDQNNTRFSFAGVWEDYDNDGDLDLYVANDFGRNNLYRNDGGRFRDVAADAAVEDISAGMGVTWADYDNDGYMDLYVSNMFSSAGGRIAYQKRFQDASHAEARAAFRRHAKGNSLFHNEGNGTFADVSFESGTTMGRWAWGSVFLDFNNDSLADIFVPNGFVTSESTKDL
ncbi:MAG: VCBS repeat-containing protein [Planctomycetes bacterium]|nr:VCBS repeat-containing protein [Planctomycetota bacterium]